MSEDKYVKGLNRRTEVLGEAYVAQAMHNAPEFNKDFQKFLTETIWGSVWDGGAITDNRERSLITLSMVCALGKYNEIKIHIRAALRMGIAPEELKSIFYHVAGYCGAPAALECFRAYHEAKAAFDAEQPRRTSDKAVGFAGLGSIGRPIATHLVEVSNPLSGFDIAGTRERLPPGAREAADIATLAAECDIVFSSLPDAKALREFVAELIQAPRRRVSLLVDLSTVGIECAGDCAALLQAAGIDYLDAPVSGGVGGARNRKLTVIAAGSRSAYETALLYLEQFSARQFHVGTRPGQAQAVKLLNNFLSATALAATSEAICFGLAEGLTMQGMLDVLNASSGRSAATEDKFVNEVMPGRFSSGFANTLMSKDVSLYFESARAAHRDGPIARLTQQIWNEFNVHMPNADFTRIYSFVAARLGKQE